MQLVLMCARNDFGGKTREDPELHEWSKDDIDKIFGQFPNLENVMSRGTHGDPCVAEHTPYAIDKIKSTTDATVEFYSNASMRTPEWWSNSGSSMNDKKPQSLALSQKNDLAIFSVDGLGDTTHLYRRRTNFEKIMENAEAYLKAGGIARWDFIVFKHNEHLQVEQAEALAKKMGFKQFRIRKTSRFDYSDGPDKWRVKIKTVK